MMTAVGSSVYCLWTYRSTMTKVNLLFLMYKQYRMVEGSVKQPFY